MGFGGGGSAGMTNHVHNSVPLQGGPLDFANDTIASLNAGSTTFSDGAALQELVIGNPSDALVVNGAGTAPEWASAVGPTITPVTDSLVATFSTTSQTYVDVTAWTLTKPTIVGGECFIVAYCTTEAKDNATNDDNSAIIAIETNGAITARTESMNSADANKMSGNVCLSDMSDADGAIIQMQCKVQKAGTMYINHNAADSIPKVDCFGVG